jgi:hypothetical protein
MRVTRALCWVMRRSIEDKACSTDLIPVTPMEY